MERNRVEQRSASLAPVPKVELGDVAGLRCGDGLENRLRSAHRLLVERNELWWWMLEWSTTNVLDRLIDADRWSLGLRRRRHG